MQIIVRPQLTEYFKALPGKFCLTTFVTFVLYYYLYGNIMKRSKLSRLF